MDFVPEMLDLDRVEDTFVTNIGRIEMVTPHCVRVTMCSAITAYGTAIEYRVRGRLLWPVDNWIEAGMPLRLFLEALYAGHPYRAGIVRSGHVH